MSAVAMEIWINWGTFVFFYATKPSRTTRLDMLMSTTADLLFGRSLSMRYLPRVQAMCAWID
jgi:hypothetical protein